MKPLLRTNIYDVNETIIIIGSCLCDMQPEAYERFKKISSNIYTLCLEESHINMAITKIGAMLSTGKVKKVIFATVDKSPHCVQVHYIRRELERVMNLDDIEITNFVVVDNQLIKIDPKIISISKNLSELSEFYKQEEK